MATLFTRIIDGEIPGTFVWEDDRCVAFLSINPLTPGHTLVVPRDEVDHWIDLPDDLAQHLMSVARTIGRAQQQAFVSERVAVIIAGYEIPHTHLHVFPTTNMGQLDFANAAASISREELDDARPGSGPLCRRECDAEVASRPMGEMVEFASNGNTASGYLVTPARGGPGVLVIQEWWGLDSSLKEVADRLGAGGLRRAGSRPVPRRAGRARRDGQGGPADAEHAAGPRRRDMSGAVDFLAGHEAVHGDGIGVVGFCMGGMLSWSSPPTARTGPGGRRVLRLPAGRHGARLVDLRGQGEGPHGRERRLLPARAGQGARGEAQAMGKDVTFTVHPGTGHAFMAPHNALGTRDEAKAEEIWPQVIAFLHEAL